MAKIRWTPADQNRALDEGWDVFDTDRGVEIQRHDEAQEQHFDSDLEAIGHVVERALQGSTLHRRALTQIGVYVRPRKFRLSRGALKSAKLFARVNLLRLTQAVNPNIESKVNMALDRAGNTIWCEHCAERPAEVEWNDGVFCKPCSRAFYESTDFDIAPATVLNIARQSLADGAHPEYRRAILELLAQTLGLPSVELAFLESLLPNAPPRLKGITEIASKAERDAAMLAIQRWTANESKIPPDRLPHIRQTVIDCYGTDDLEVNDDAAITKSAEDGYWVQVWRYVPFEMVHGRCEECTEPLPDFLPADLHAGCATECPRCGDLYPKSSEHHCAGSIYLVGPSAQKGDS